MTDRPAGMRAPKTTEAAFQRQVVQLAHTLGWLVQHTRPAQHGDRWMTPITGDVGFPDLVLVHPARGVIFVELKTERGAVSDAQYKWGRAIRDAGGEWRIWRPKDMDDIQKRLNGRATRHDHSRAKGRARLHGAAEQDHSG